MHTNIKYIKPLVLLWALSQLDVEACCCPICPPTHSALHVVETQVSTVVFCTREKYIWEVSKDNVRIKTFPISL